VVAGEDPIPDLPPVGHIFPSFEDLDWVKATKAKKKRSVQDDIDADEPESEGRPEDAVGPDAEGPDAGGPVNHSLTLWQLIELLEVPLSFHAFYKCGSPYQWSTTCESFLRTQIRTMMSTIKSRAPRKTNREWRLQKFHELLHIASDMRKFGAPQNYDAGPGESSLKRWAKKPAKTSQKMGALRFSEQVAARLHEMSCFDKMERNESKYTPPKELDDDDSLDGEDEMFPIRHLDAKSDQEDNDDDSEADTDAKCEADTEGVAVNDANSEVNSEADSDVSDVSSELIGRPKFQVSSITSSPQCYVDDCVDDPCCKEEHLEPRRIIKWSWLGKRRQRGIVEIQPTVLRHISAELLEYPEVDIVVKGYTEYKRDNVLFRAHPNYHSTGLWYDWVHVS
jgi:hypothetical protein